MRLSGSFDDARKQPPQKESAFLPWNGLLFTQAGAAMIIKLDDTPA
jgi:hypothetical protein